VKVGIGLPTTVKGVRGQQLTEWARRAEAAGFDSLATMDGLAFPNYEPFVALGAAAAVTEWIELITAIAILPYRQNAALVAKQAATLHHLSGGRLSFGIAIGGSAADYAASGVPWRQRGRRFDEMIEELHRVWTGEDAAFRAAGRAERPRALAGGFFSLGEHADAEARRGLGAYFAAEPELAEPIIAGALTDVGAIRETLEEFERRGCDDFLLFPASADPAQVDLLAAAVG
jgi:Luciferase-like monooxygenase